MRVLFFVDAYPGDSCRWANPFLHSQAKALIRKNIEVRILCPTPWVPAAMGGRFSHLRHAAAFECFDSVVVDRPRFLRLPRRAGRRTAPALMARFASKSFRRIVEDWRPDLVHAHMATPAGAAGLRLAREAGLPFVLTVHGLDVTTLPASDRVLETETRRVCGSADRTVCVSRYLLEQTHRLTRGTGNFAQAYIGVDRTKFLPDAGLGTAVRRLLGIDADMPMIGFVGRLEREKGVLDLIDAVNILRAQGRAPATVIVGDGSAARIIREVIDGLDFGGTVRLLGAYPPEDLPAIYSAIDLLVAPSWEDALGLACLEAQACGTPVIASDIPGHREAIVDGSTGLLAGLGAPDDLAKQIDRLLADREQLARMGGNGRDHVAEQFDLEICTDRLIEIYHDVA